MNLKDRLSAGKIIHIEPDGSIFRNYNNPDGVAAWARIMQLERALDNMLNLYAWHVFHNELFAAKVKDLHRVSTWEKAKHVLEKANE